MKASTFDQRYQDEGDPWGYRTSDYEREKYRATLAACGDGPFRSALELAGSIGVFSAMLAPRCEELTTIDFSETAVAQARQELHDFPQATALIGEIPGALPDRQYDLIVASEILYYLEPGRWMPRCFAWSGWSRSADGWWWCTGGRRDPSGRSVPPRSMTGSSLWTG